jgi:hypothetical protein
MKIVMPFQLVKYRGENRLEATILEYAEVHYVPEIDELNDKDAEIKCKEIAQILRKFVSEDGNKVFIEFDTENNTAKVLEN